MTPRAAVAPILARSDAAGFWLAVVLTGLGTGLAAAALTGLLDWCSTPCGPGRGADLLDADTKVAPWWHMLVLVRAGVLTGVGQLRCAGACRGWWMRPMRA